ncbi:PepSY-associated TM helix domain-containing protein [Pedobacter sp. AW31-3R]|uniref:PepSY-associated TM helix domain-containing protein n=1 Tax=Pedobacter sp. AW31-3R TaxID=3445781 RepID=UPI003F9F5B3D
MSRLAFTLHSWLGLISGIFLLLLGLSGSALVFMKEIDHLVNADILRVEPRGERLPLDMMYRSILKNHPTSAGIAWLNPDAEPEEVYEFRLYQNDGKLSTYDLAMVSVNPYSGKIIREGNLKDLSTGFLHWMVQFHWSFQLGIPGLLLATIFALTMLLSTLTGVIIYRKHVWKVLTFREKLKCKNWRTLSSGLHRIVGVWALVFNIVIFLTGFWMNKFSFDPAYWKRQTIAMPESSLAVRNIDQLLSKAKTEMPDLIIKKVYMPTQPGKNFLVSGTVASQSAVFGNANSIALDPLTGKTVAMVRIADQNIPEKLEAAVFPLHVGNFGGVIIKVFYVIIGLLPGLLSITGALLWWRKFRKKRVF